MKVDEAVRKRSNYFKGCEAVPPHTKAGHPPYARLRTLDLLRGLRDMPSGDETLETLLRLFCWMTSYLGPSKMVCHPEQK
jgi:hypothetical protein